MTMAHLRTYTDLGLRIADCWPNVDIGSIVLEHTITGRRELFHACARTSPFAVCLVGPRAYQFGRVLAPGRISPGAR
jgi:hypothetical protein